MASINDVIKLSFLRMKKDGKQFIPEEYKKVFCAEMTRVGLRSDECTGIDRFKNKLDKKTKTKLATYRIKTQEEFISFLTGELNRYTKSSQINDDDILLEAIIKLVLKAITILHNKNFTKLAETSILHLSEARTSEKLTLIKDSWVKIFNEFSNENFNELKNKVSLYLLAQRTNFESVKEITTEKYILEFDSKRYLNDKNLFDENEVFKFIKSHKLGLVNAPAGIGKSEFIRILSKHYKVLIITPQTNIAREFIKDYTLFINDNIANSSIMIEGINNSAVMTTDRFQNNKSDIMDKINNNKFCSYAHFFFVILDF